MINGALAPSINATNYAKTRDFQETEEYQKEGFLNQGLKEVGLVRQRINGVRFSHSGD